MLGEVGREGRDGQVVVFRLEGDELFLWKVASTYVPRENELVGPLVNDHADTWYKVEQVKSEIWWESGQAGGGEVPEEPWTAETGLLCPCVIVSEVV